MVLCGNAGTAALRLSHAKTHAWQRGQTITHKTAKICVAPGGDEKNGAFRYTEVVLEVL
jgi:hypothetical protein